MFLNNQIEITRFKHQSSGPNGYLQGSLTSAPATYLMRFEEP